jgi:hypothetical protein
MTTTCDSLKILVSRNLAAVISAYSGTAPFAAVRIRGFIVCPIMNFGPGIERGAWTHDR